jgi:pimeloyl-ACP methyl ester carboxylesterase
MMGNDKVGRGARAVVVLNDWIGDTSTWDGARAYLDGERYTWAFADLRGYGRSRARAGEHTVEEAAADVIELADDHGWPRFAIVGHSMSSLVALHLAQRSPERIDRAIAITPPPPTGFGADDALLESMRAVGRGDDELRMTALRRMLGERAAEGFIRFKVARWRACADPEAVAEYVPMFARRGLPDPTKAIARPVLAVTGEHDAPPMRSESVTKLLGPLCADLTVVPFADCGHYPMQEAPPLLVATIERFLAREPQ